MLPTVSGVIGGSADNSVLLFSLTITLCAIFFEDISTVVVGLLAADGVIGVPHALISLYVGALIGDALFYALGSFARRHPRLAHYIDHNFTAPFRLWIGRSYRFKVFSGHFIPGFRFTTFVASGFFGFPFRQYFPMAMAGGAVLVLVLFSVSYWFGSITTGWLTHVRWGVAIAFLIALFFIGRHNLLVYRAQKASLDNALPPQ